MKNGRHVDKNGTKRWYLNDKRHREEGPAVIYIDGTRFWCMHDKLHRLDGPAVEDYVHDSENSESWYLNDEYLGDGTVGFWAHWQCLTHAQRCDLNLHKWLAKYS